MTTMRTLADPVIMVVDGDPDSLGLCEQILSAAGYGNLRLCMSPDEALEAMGDLNVDLVICDFATPCIDGLHLLRLIRDTVSEGDFIPMLALSGDAKPGTRDEVMTLGADAFLTKPVGSVEMILWVEHLLELRAIRRSSSHPELASGRGVDRATAMQRLENVFRAREVFIAGVSHELRTPLTAVLG